MTEGYKSTRTAALLLVDNERNRQDAKWGEQNHVPEVWVGILGEEYGEYCEAVNETVFNNGPDAKTKGGTANMITELTHVAAVAVGAIECLIRAEARKDKELTRGAVIDRLRELISDRKSFIYPGGEDNDVYKEDIKALEFAIEYMQRTEGGK